MTEEASQKNQRNDRKEGPASTQQQNGAQPPLWRYAIWFVAALLLASFIMNRYSQAGSVRISYTQFKKQIENENIAEVTFRGNSISGTFDQPWSKGGDEDGGGQQHTKFTTVKPPVDDSELITMLENNDVTVSAKAQERNLFTSVVIMLVPWILIIAAFVYLSNRAQGRMKNMMGGGGGGGGLFNIGKSKAKRFREKKATTRYSDVAGLQNAKKDLGEIVAYLKNPKKFLSLGAQIPKGVLMMGAPGTGKTLLARATAGEAQVPFYSISGSEFIEMFVGVGASRVRDMFETAKKESPAIIFIDEIDSIGRSRGTGLGGGHDEREQTLNQVLAEMDGFEPHQSVIVIAATNRPDVLDPALTRPGRFDRQITLELPQREARTEILKIHARNVPVADDVDLDNIAARTVGFSGADLKNLVNEAALLAGRNERNTVKREDFDLASDKILLGAEREDQFTDDEKNLIAYHESGHALTAKLIPGADPLQKVTIIPRGRALGATEQIPETDRHNFKRSYLLDRIAVALGGRVSEQIIFQDITNGSAQDLKGATQIARKMVCQWGMSEKVGPVVFKRGESHAFLGRELTQEKDFSENTAMVIDEEIKNIVGEMEDKVRKLLTDNRQTLDKLASQLLEHETLTKDEVDEIIGNGKK
ncbi:MAG: ATP-dependent zinc metalloprotease FtsH [Chitinivibrionales bacterium]|nr:ATP-dependent zinc metalloprotease FtsH [Chitinivibrionales bacterium]